MKKLLISILSCLLACPFISAQQTIDLTTGVITNGIQSTTPTRDVEIVSDGVIVTYNFTKATLTGDDLYPTSKFVKINGFGMNTNVGEPSTLQRWDSFVVPLGIGYSVSLLDTAYIEIPMDLSPARPLLPNNRNVSHNLDNVLPINSYIGCFPQEVAFADSLQDYRDTNILPVRTSPIQYDYINHIVRAYKTIKYKVNYGTSLHSGWGIGLVTNNKWDPFLNNTTLNYAVSNPLLMPRNEESNSTQQQRTDYLIVSVPMFKNSIDKFAEWKRMLGFTVHIMMVDSTWTPQYIRSKMKEVYDSCVTVEGIKTLEHILIIGDHQNVPAQYYEDFYTDYFYSVMRSVNYFLNRTPNVSVGRLPVATIEQAEVVVNKIINYEKNPPTYQSFYKGASFCAYFQDDDSNQFTKDGIEDLRSVKTSEEVRSYMMEQNFWDTDRIYAAEDNVYPQEWSSYYSEGGDIGDDLKKPHYSWDIYNIASDIESAFNSGLLYISYIGHGDANSWSSIGFNKTNIDHLRNGNWLPIVFSMTCLSGNFVEDECFAEALLRKEDAGSVAVFASTAPIPVGNTEAMFIGMIESIWPTPGIGPDYGHFSVNQPQSTTQEPEYRLGWIKNQGIRSMETYYNSFNSSNYKLKRAIQCFGDPSMEFYTDIPTGFANVSVTRTDNSIHVDLGMDSAKITFYNKITNEVISYIGNSADYSGPNSQVSVCVSGHNRIPYIDVPDSHIIYIQNETIYGDASYHADIIKVGSNVTPTKPAGKVTFNGGRVTLTGSEVDLQGETEITLGTEFEIRN